MSWIITGSFAQPDEPEALDYIAAVEAADGQTLEDGVKFAYNSFIKGCKADGIWDAIKASCILAGAKTLDGALVPLVGTAPTNYNFVAGDYNRETGLLGDGSTKYLNSNRANISDPQNSNHNAAYVTFSGLGAIISAGGTTAANNIYDDSNNVYSRNRSSTPFLVASPIVGFAGHSRASSTEFGIRMNSSTSFASAASLTPVNADVVLFQRNGAVYSTHRLAFYSIGESLDLALLDARVTTLMSDLAAAIP